jgi:TRAP-type C4-dicarboxylate transport system substrate-binding protein
MKLLLFTLLILSPQIMAKKVKLAFLAPEGTNWAINIKKMAKEIEKKTEKRIKFKLYFGGVAGDEPDVLRKIRSGQLHGGIFSGKTLGDIFSEVRVMELPFTFNSNSSLAYPVLDKMSDYFKKGFAKNGFISLGMLEIGHVYVVSTKPIKDLNEMKGVKVWTWEGDPLVHAMTSTLNLIPVPLAITDVLSSLNTGIIQATYAPPMGIAAFQWHTKTKYLIDYPIAYAVASFLISQKAWKKIPAKDQKIISEVAEKFMRESNTQTQEDNVNTLAQFKQMGIKFIPFPSIDTKKSSTIRNQVISKLKNSTISEKTLKMLDSTLKTVKR